MTTTNTSTAMSMIRFNSGRLYKELTEVTRVLTRTKRMMGEGNDPENMELVAKSLTDIAAFMSAKAEINRQISAWIVANKEICSPIEFPPLYEAMNRYEVAYEKVQFI